MFNVKYRTFAPKTLITLTEASGTAAYDPNVIPELLAMLNFPSSVTVHFPSNEQYSFFGFIQKVEFKELKEGEQPELDYTIGITNYDYINNVEAGPLYTPAPGTV